MEKLPTPNCTQYRVGGKCAHPSAPRRVLGAAICCIPVPSPDPRVIPGCAIQIEFNSQIPNQTREGLEPTGFSRDEDVSNENLTNEK